MKLVALLLLLAACDKGKRDRPAPPPTGMLKGQVTSTINGPGRAHAAEESFSRTVGIECKVLVIDRSGNTFEAKSRSDGGYELTVPAGHYDVSFGDCQNGRSCDVPTPKPVEIAADGAATLDWDCQMDAK